VIENLPASAGGFVGGYTGASNTHHFFGNTEGQVMQPGGDYSDTCIVGRNGAWPDEVGDCFRILPNEWTTFLLHVIPGKHVHQWAGWPRAADPTTGTGIQLWGATQTRIDSMRNAGLVPTYQCIYNRVGVDAYPFFYTNGDLASQVNDGVSPPGFNEVRLWSYQNFIPQAFGFRRWFTQVIFKKGNGLQNQEVNSRTFDPQVDGIPCPMY
jgi:hypothetical protein